MEARSTGVAIMVAVLCAASTAARCAQAATYTTPNFVVTTQNPEHAKAFALEAEKLRDDLAVLWTGEKMPRWWRPAVIHVTVGERLQGGGATTFEFDQRRREVFGWRMNIQGSYQRVLDSVLPHEITHMVFASHFRQPVPRWADEGAAVASENPQEQARHRKMLVNFLRTGYGIPFSRMYAMTQYPSDMNQMLALYAQGFSTTEYLIQLGGHRRFVQFLEDGLATGDWAQATSKHYGFSNLSAFQADWNRWVAADFPPLSPLGSPNAPATAIAGNTTPAPIPVAPVSASAPLPVPPSAALVAQTQPTGGDPWSDRSVYHPNPDRRLRIDPAVRPVALTEPLQATRAERPAYADMAPVPPWQPGAQSPPAGSAESTVSTDRPATSYVSRPSAPEPIRQVILEWSRY